MEDVELECAFVREAASLVVFGMSRQDALVVRDDGRVFHCGFLVGQNSLGFGDTLLYVGVLARFQIRELLLWSSRRSLLFAR